VSLASHRAKAERTSAGVIDGAVEWSIHVDLEPVEVEHHQVWVESRLWWFVAVVVVVVVVVVVDVGHHLGVDGPGQLLRAVIVLQTPFPPCAAAVSPSPQPHTRPHTTHDTRPHTTAHDTRHTTHDTTHVREGMEGGDM
jgi:hypothetical protein